MVKRQDMRPHRSRRSPRSVVRLGWFHSATRGWNPPPHNPNSSRSRPVCRWSRSVGTRCRVHREPCSRQHLLCLRTCSLRLQGFRFRRHPLFRPHPHQPRLRSRWQFRLLYRQPQPRPCRQFRLLYNQPQPRPCQACAARGRAWRRWMRKSRRRRRRAPRCPCNKRFPHQAPNPAPHPL